VSNAPVLAITSKSGLAQPLTFVGPAAQQSTQAPVPGVFNGPPPSTKAGLPDKPAGSDAKRKVETGLTAAGIAAIIVQASRDQYHAGGRPRACPDDTARNGSACGGRSAYSRPGGAAPLCYPSDVTAAMIDAYRHRQRLSSHGQLSSGWSVNSREKLSNGGSILRVPCQRHIG
jgi:hypothetical protein